MKVLKVAAMLVASAFTVSGTTILSISPVMTTVNNGDAFSVNVLLSSDRSDIGGFDIAIAFPTFLDVLSVNEAGYFALNGFGISPVIDNVNGTISGMFDAAIGPDDSTDPTNILTPGPDTLLTIMFHANAAGIGTISVTCDLDSVTTMPDCVSFPLLSNSDGGSAIDPDTLVSGNVTVNKVVTSAVPEPSTFLSLAACGVAAAFFRRKRRAA